MPKDDNSKYNNARGPPEEFEDDILHVSSTRKICAVKINGVLGCWNANNNNVFEHVPNKFRDNVR